MNKSQLWKEIKSRKLDANITWKTNVKEMRQVIDDDDSKNNMKSELARLSAIGNVFNTITKQAKKNASQL